MAYGFLASVLPVWMLLTPRDYLSTFMKIGTIVLLAIGILVTLPLMQNEAVTKFASSGEGPVFAGALFPFVFITIACGALSGFHSLIASGTTPKMIEKERQVRFIGYGAMLMESFVAVMAIIAASIIDPGLYYAMNAPAGVLGDTVQSASARRSTASASRSPRASCRRPPPSVDEQTLVARTGGAPTLAIGMSEIFAGATGDSLKAFWYHFAIMFEALFILTTVDAGTRVGRFMLQDTLGNVWKPIGRVSWKPGLWATSAIVVGAWGYFLYTGVTNPLGGINQLFPLFGIANQLLAAVALTRLHDAADQVGPAEVGVGDRHPARLGRGGDAHRELPEGVLRQPEDRLLRAARRVQGRDRRGQGAAAGQEHGRDARGGHELDRRRHPRRAVRGADHRRARSTSTRIWIKALRARRPPADVRGQARAVEARRAGRADPDRRGPRGDGEHRRRRYAVQARGADGDRDDGERAVTVKQAFAGVRWYLREVSGESAYDRYVEHMRRDHPDQPVMSRRDFERRRQDAREENPRARCC